MTSTTFFIIFIPILAILLLAINLILAPHNPYQEKDSVFECGFHSFLGQNRTQFSVSFFIFGILFLLFDLEIVLIYPYSVSSYTNDVYGLVVMMVFFVLLTLGFIFELGKNALTIDSRQTFYNNGDISTPHAFISIASIFWYIWAVIQLFSDYLRILTDKCAPVLKWTFDNSPKPHAFSSLELQSSLRTDIAKFEKSCSEMPSAEKLEGMAGNNPSASDIRGTSDTLRDDVDRNKETLIGKINDQREAGNMDNNRAEELIEKVNLAAEEAAFQIRESNNVAVEGIDDTSDTEGYIIHILPVIFVSELPIIRILYVIYTLYNLNIFYIWIYYGTLLMNKIGKK